MYLLQPSVFRELLSTVLVALCAFPAWADEAPPTVLLGARLTSDLLAVAQGANGTGIRMLGNLDLVADVDLNGLVSWQGARVKLHALSNQGGHPNDLVGTLQGIDNIEVTDNRTKLYQAWIEQDLFGGKVSVLAGLADLNADFYQNDSAGLLLAPAFGIGSELAATGPNGPSIFPSTALTARVRVALNRNMYVKAAIINAKSGVVGDPGGIDWGMHEGALMIGELGLTGRGKLAVGYWHYTRHQADIRITTPGGLAAPAIAQGAYLLIDQAITSGEAAGPTINVFARVGISDGATTAFGGGGQLGVLMTKLISARPESQMSVGVNHGVLSSRYRANSSDGGIPLSRSETGFELTFSDQLTSNLRVQPDIQYVLRPSGDRKQRNAIVFGIRLMLTTSRAID